MKIFARNSLIVICAVLIILLGTHLFLQKVMLSYTDFAADREASDGTSRRDLARVVEIEEPVVDRLSPSKPLWENPERGRGLDRHQIVVMKIVTGPYKGRFITADNILHFKPSANAVVRKGTLVHISYIPVNDRFYDIILLKPIVRFPFITYCAALLLILLVLAARDKGVKICISLVLAALMTYYILIPLMVAGFSPIGVVLLFSFLLACVIFIIVGQFNLKGLSAGIGAAGGLLVAFLVAIIFSHFLNLSGIFSTRSRFLCDVLEKANIRFDLVAFIIASSTVCILGIVMDVGISIAAGVHQVYAQRPDSSRAALFNAGISISKDVCPTMVITLIFAYVGLQIHIFFLMKGAFLSPREFLNSESVSVELIQVVCGAIGLLLSGPIAALAAALLLPVGRKSLKDSGRLAADSGNGKSRKVFLLVEIIIILTLAFLIGRGVLRQRAYYQRIGLPADAEKMAAKAAGEVELKELAGYWAENFYFDDAIYALLHAGEAAAEDPAVHRDLAYLYVQKKFLIPAHAEISKAMTLGAKDLKTFYTAGVVNAWLGSNEEARAYLEKALKIDPENQEVKLALQVLEGKGAGGFRPVPGQRRSP